MTVVFVCSGNTCRSPMAEHLFRKLLREKLGERAGGCEILSAGLAAAAGEPANPQAGQVLGEQGVDLSGHRARRLDLDLARKADLLLVMTEAQRRAVLEMDPGLAGRVFTLKGFPAPQPGEGGTDIEDPYGGSEEDYRRTAAQIGQALEAVAAAVAAQLGEGENDPGARSGGGGEDEADRRGE